MVRPTPVLLFYLLQFTILIQIIDMTYHATTKCGHFWDMMLATLVW
jgi:hypothetical protein